MILKKKKKKKEGAYEDPLLLFSVITRRTGNVNLREHVKNAFVCFVKVSITN